MSDFVVPNAWFLDRNTITSELGLGTLLGNASPVSAKWDYMRQPWAQPVCDDR